MVVVPPRFVAVVASVAVPALPLVFAALFGMSALTKARNPGNAALPLPGPANTWLAVCELKPKVCVPLAEMVEGVALMYAGRDHVIEPMPDPEPENVHVVLVQDTPDPVKVNAPVAELIEETPPLLPAAGAQAVHTESTTVVQVAI